MSLKPIISASILSADFAHLENQIQMCETGGVDWIHIDVMDGHFVPNLTMGPFIVETSRRITSLPLDCHLMIEKPENFIDAFLHAGANTITIHSENNPTVVESLHKIRSFGCLAGLAVNPETPIKSILPYLEFIDLVLIMTVHPGYSGQGFIPETLEKVKMVSELLSKYPGITYLQVDGGINSSTIPLVKNAGANCFVAATAIFKNPAGVLQGIRELRKALD